MAGGLTSNADGVLFGNDPKDLFYQQVGAAQRSGLSNEQVANQYANNPYGVSFQELLGDFSGYAPTQTGGSGDGGAAAANAAYIADQNRLIDFNTSRADTQFGVANDNALSQYNDAFNTLMGNKGIAERNYKTARDQSQQDNIQAKSNINENVRNQYTGIQRLLGSRGAGNSSAAQILAPYAAGRTGNIQRSQVQQAYGRNMGALDTNWGDTQNQYTNSFSDLDRQKQTNLNRNLSKYNEVKAGLLGQRGAIDPNNRGAYEAQANDLFRQVDQLGRDVAYTPKAVTTKPVDLAQYNYDKYGAPSTGSNVNSAIVQGVGPYWSLLNKEEEKKAVI